MRMLVVLAGALLVTACGADRPPSSDATASTARESARATDETGISGKSGMPESNGSALLDRAKAAIVSGPYKLRYDRISSRGGLRQRQILIEALGPSLQESTELARRTLTSLGCTVSSERSLPGRVRIRFSKEGSDPVSAYVRDAKTGAPLKNAGATSSIYLSDNS